MIRFLFILSITFILISFSQKYLVFLRISRLKQKIKRDPLIGLKDEDDSYYYKEKGYTLSYRIRESPDGIKKVEWLSLKRRLTFFEKYIFNIKKDLNNFFLYQRWLILFRPSVAIILITALIIFYLGIQENSLKRIERFRWVIAQITGIRPEAIGYTGAGLFTIAGKKTSLDKKPEQVTISFNPLRWLFFSDTATVSRWSEKSNRYLNYPVTISDKGDVWLDKKSGQIHGRVLDNSVVWDEPQKTGTRDKVSGHHITVENGRLNIFDE